MTGFAASLFRRNAVAGGGGGVPRRRRFRTAGKTVEIDTYKSPTLAITCRPFEIVQQRLGVVALHSTARTHRLVHGLEMLMKKHPPGLVVRRITAVCYVVRNAVFRDQDLRRPIVPPEPCQDVMEALWVNLLPTSGGDRMSLERLTMTIDDYRRVVFDPQVVDRRGDDGEVAILDCALKAAGKSAIGMAEGGVVTSQERLEVEGVFEDVGGISCGGCLRTGVRGVTGSKLQAWADLAGCR